MVNVRMRCCAHPGCSTRPAFSEVGMKIPKYCSVHKQPGMMNVRVKSCAEEGCRSRPRHGLPGQSAGYCAKHKKPGMVLVVGKLCEYKDCKTLPSFNVPEKWSPAVCQKHKSPGMVNVLLGKPCIFEGCRKQANYSEPGQPRSHCEQHKTSGMTWNNRWLCAEPNCKTQPMYGTSDSTAYYCARHRKPGQQNFSSRNRLKILAHEAMSLQDNSRPSQPTVLDIPSLCSSPEGDRVLLSMGMDQILQEQMYSAAVASALSNASNAFFRTPVGKSILQQHQQLISSMDPDGADISHSKAAAVPVIAANAHSSSSAQSSSTSHGSMQGEQGTNGVDIISATAAAGLQNGQPPMTLYDFSGHYGEPSETTQDDSGASSQPQSTAVSSSHSSSSFSQNPHSVGFVPNQPQSQGFNLESMEMLSQFLSSMYAHPPDQPNN
eukprot:gb/GEZN01003562.1/.p1 GENE.gb/GEZN01003562.1/~~gb/GEZN01003562.1/.p1  ORF type:complete len:434 (-),score=54.94 gb/GEZN01003562.1/:554-1855(-)